MKGPKNPILPYASDSPKALAVVNAWYRYMNEEMQYDNGQQYAKRRALALKELRKARYSQLKESNREGA